MRRSIIIVVILLCCSSLFAQSSSLSVRIVVPQDELPQQAKSLLLSKLKQIATNYEMVEDGLSGRFVLTADVLTLAKEVVPVAPPQISQKLNIVLYFGDVVDEKLFSALTIPIAGVGSNESKAYNDAFKRIPTKSPILTQWVEEVKNKVRSYFDDQCANIIAQADFLALSGDYDSALESLLSVPEFCTSSIQAKEKALEVYRQKIDKEGESLYQKAKSIWTIGQNSDAAQEAMALLSEIDVNSKASASVSELASEIGKKMSSHQAKMQEKEQREWEFQIKQYQDNIELKRQQLKDQTAIDKAKAEAIRTATNKVAGIDFGKVTSIIKNWFGK